MIFMDRYVVIDLIDLIVMECSYDSDDSDDSSSIGLRSSPLNFGRFEALSSEPLGADHLLIDGSCDSGRFRELGTLRWSPHAAPMISCGFSRINSSPSEKGGRTRVPFVLFGGFWGT